MIGYILEGDNLAGYEALPIIFLLIIGITIELYDNKLRYDEVPNKVLAVLQKMGTEMNFINWTEVNYPDLFSPLSPCITLQWTYRDGKLVNLPWALLVKDDIVLMRPGKVTFIIFCLFFKSWFPHNKSIYSGVGISFKVDVHFEIF